jgi:hypothetical protein
MHDNKQQLCFAYKRKHEWFETVFKAAAPD